MMTLFFIFALVAVCVACSFLKTSLRIWTGAVASILRGIRIRDPLAPLRCRGRICASLGGCARDSRRSR